MMQKIIPTYNVTVSQKRIIKYNTNSMWDKLETKVIMDSGKMGYLLLIIRCIYEKPQRAQRKATTFCVLVCKN